MRGQPQAGNPFQASGAPATTFGAAAKGAGGPTTAFGSSAQAFGKVTTAFGQGSSAAQPAFGQPSQPAFGQQNKPGLGQQSNPAFGQQSKPGFGQQSNPAFGQQSKPGFGQQSKPEFGQQSKPAFGQQSKPEFGQQSKPTFGQQSRSGSNRSGFQPSPPSNGATGGFGPRSGSNRSGFQPSPPSNGATGGFGSRSGPAPAFGGGGGGPSGDSRPGSASNQHFPPPPLASNPFATGGTTTPGPSPGSGGFTPFGNRGASSSDALKSQTPGGSAPGIHTTFGSASSSRQRRSSGPKTGTFAPDTSSSDSLPFQPPLPPNPPLPNSQGRSRVSQASQATPFQPPLPQSSPGAGQGRSRASPGSQSRTMFGNPKSFRGLSTQQTFEGAPGTHQSPGLEARTTFGSGKQGSRGKKADQQFGTTTFGNARQSTSQADQPPAKISPFGEKPNKRSQKRQETSGKSNHMIPPQSNATAPDFTPEVFTANNSAAAASATAALEKAELATASNLNGLCIDMCSPAERELHIRVDELSVFEKCFPGQPGKEQDLIIKRFQRSSADHKLDIPEEIRPPGVLRLTQLYIEDEIMDLETKGDDSRFNPPRTPEIIELYNFCWDRFRMIRKDFVLQNYRGAGGRVHPIVLDVHERIARYHVLSEHELCEVTSFVAQQNMEQLGQTLKSLNELYDESRKLGDPRLLSPFEAECRAYFILCTLDNGRGLDVLKFVKGLPRAIVESAHVKFAMKVFVARHTGNYQQFFTLLRQATYLQACLLFRYISNMRSRALQRMNRAYRTQTYPLEELVELLCFDDLDQAGQICSLHGLKIVNKALHDGEENYVVSFGDLFETDAELRKNKTPLPVQASVRFISAKRENYLRRDICRGVTEYDEYPALSNLIEAFELEERARLYPSRPRYEDDYSYFVDFAEAGPPTITSQPGQSSQGWSQVRSSGGAGFFGADETDDSLGMEPEDGNKTHELQLIAQRKAQLEQKQQEMKDRIRKLELEKQERERAEREKKAQIEREELESKQEEKAIAKQKAEKEAALKRQQEELAQRAREAEQQRILKLKLEKEAEERRKQAEEAARIQREREEAERRRQELLRVQAAEEERRRQEAMRIAEARRKEEEERKRLQQIAEEKARMKREEERRVQLARELAEKKRLQRIRKQLLAVLKFRFHLWKKYSHTSRHQSGPALVSLNTPAASSHVGATDKINWLFERKNRMASLISKNHSRGVTSTVPAAVPPKSTAVPPIDMFAVVAPSLRNRQPNVHLITWKLLIVDLQSNMVPPGSASFGQWCAARVGITSTTGEFSEESHCVYEAVSNSEKAFGVLPCCRYVNVGTLRSEQRLDALSSVSAMLVPVELTWIQDSQQYQQWESVLAHVISSLPPSGSIALVILASATEGVRKSAVAPLLDTIERSVRRMQLSSSPRVAAVCFHLMVNEDGGNLESMSRRFEQVVTDAAVHSSLHPQLVEIGLKDLVDAVIRDVESPEGSASNEAGAKQFQTQICGAIHEIHQEIFSNEVMGRDFPPPELQRVLPEPPVGWNSPDKQKHVKVTLQALASSHIDFSSVEHAQPFKPNQVCDYFFKLVSAFVDRLFEPVVSTEMSVYELKKRIFSEFVPIHERLAKQQDVLSPQEASRAIPWRTVFSMVYGAFAEALEDTSIYAPVGSALHHRVLIKKDCRIKPNLRAPQKLKRVDAPHPFVVSVKHLKDALGGRVPTIALSSLSIGDRKNEDRIESNIAPRATTRALQRLRVDLDREKAASTQFRHMLRLEMQRWSVDTAP